MDLFGYFRYFAPPDLMYPERLPPSQKEPPVAKTQVSADDVMQEASLYLTGAINQLFDNVNNTTSSLKTFLERNQAGTLSIRLAYYRDLLNSKKLTLSDLAEALNQFAQEFKDILAEGQHGALLSFKDRCLALVVSGENTEISSSLKYFNYLGML